MEKKTITQLYSRRDFIGTVGAGALGTFLFPDLVFAKESVTDNLGIVPFPKKIFFNYTGKRFCLGAFHNHIVILASPNNKLFMAEELTNYFLQKHLKTSFSIFEPIENLPIKHYLIFSNPGTKLSVPSDMLLCPLTTKITQSYFLDVQENCIFCGSNDIAGLAHAIRSVFDFLNRVTPSESYPLFSIVDYPDFVYRSPMSLYTLQVGLRDSNSFYDIIKEYLDFLAQRKVNAMPWPQLTIAGDWKLNNKWYYGEINRHALNRGIRLFVETTFDLGILYIRIPGVKNTRLCMGDESLSGYCYGHDMINKKKELIEAFCSEYRPGGIIFHTIDSDPHRWHGKPGWWENRCSVCQARYKDDERWKADVDQINAFYKAVKTSSPETEVMVVLWPYHPRMITSGWNLFKGSENLYREYLLRVTSHTPQDIWIATRECSYNDVDTWLEHVNGHPVAWWIYPGRRNHWIYTSYNGMPTWHRKNHRMSLFWADSGLWMPFELSNMMANQFAWSVDTPGGTIYKSTKAMHSAWQSANIGTAPPIIIDEVLPKIANSLYGKAGPYVLKALKTNIERNDPYHPRDTAEPGWRYSRFEYDIEGKIPSASDHTIHDPVEVFTTIRNEAVKMHSAMDKAVEFLPSEKIRKYVVLCIREKSKQLRARSEGFYNWMLASQILAKGGTARDVESYISKALSAFKNEEFLMRAAAEKGFPPEVTPIFGYVPIYWKPADKLLAWCKERHIEIPPLEKEETN